MKDCKYQGMSQGIFCINFLAGYTTLSTKLSTFFEQKLVVTKCNIYPAFLNTIYYSS